MLKRFGFLILVNLGIMASIMIVLNLLGVRNYLTPMGMDYEALLAFCFVYGMVGAFVSLLLSKQMAKWFMGVRILDPKTIRADERALLDTIYRFAKQNNLAKMPEVGIYQNHEVNAFATGPSRNNSLVAVSSGLLSLMNDREVEGVLAHEVSHIANGDMVTMTLLQGTVNAFVMFFSKALAWILAQALSQRDNDERGSHPSYMLVFVLEMAFYFVFGLLGSMVVAWFSRQREYRADAGAARTAGTSSMIAALEKLKNVYRVGSPVEASQDSFSNFKISGNGSFLSLLSTHPSLDERISRLRSNRF